MKQTNYILSFALLLTCNDVHAFLSSAFRASHGHHGLTIPPTFMAKEEFASASVTDTTAANMENDYVEDPFDDPFGDDAPEISRLKVELLELASATNRGFSATRRQRQSARELCERLNRLNPTREPLYPFYSSKDKLGIGGPSLVGKWTLIYTDAPDITSLDVSGPFTTAKLGRIGQECDPPFIKNVIEWKKPEWADRLPFSLGSDDSRVLQKVCTEAVVDPNKPMVADLKVVGVDLSGYSGVHDEDMKNKTSTGPFQTPAEFLEKNPVELRGPLKAPFGKFEVLYLDDRMRIIKTYQGFIAINIRQDKNDEWF